MKICKRGLNYLQIINPQGDVRICSWLNEKGNNGIVGNLMESSLVEIYRGRALRALQEQFAHGDYSVCDSDACNWLATNSIDNISVDIDTFPEYPSELYLAYEGVCNYDCTVCSSHGNMVNGRNNWEKNYEIIDDRVREVLPYVKRISANGRGELFCSKHILQLLSEWSPISNPAECSVGLETNGSLFNEKNWDKISNLGNYNLSVTITVMSFNELTYQYLSGTSLPISNLISNLKFVSELRKKGIVNSFIIKNIVQSRNFMELPDFVKLCLDEFEMDTIMLRPVFPWGPANPNIRWFEDVRNPYHPYHGQFLKVIEDPIFQDPKVFLFSGLKESPYGEHPGIRVDRVISSILKIEDFVEYTNNKLKELNCNKVSIYGFARTGKLLMKLWGNRIEIAQLFDNKKSKIGTDYNGITICSPHEGKFDDDTLVLVTPLAPGKTLKKEIMSYGHQKVLTIEEFLEIGCNNC